VKRLQKYIRTTRTYDVMSPYRNTRSGLLLLATTTPAAAAANEVKITRIYIGWPEKNVPKFCMALCHKSAEKHVCNEQTSLNMSFYMYINEFSPKTLPY